MHVPDSGREALFFVLEILLIALVKSHLHEPHLDLHLFLDTIENLIYGFEATGETVHIATIIPEALFSHILMGLSDFHHAFLHWPLQSSDVSLVHFSG